MIARIAVAAAQLNEARPCSAMAPVALIVADHTPVQLMMPREISGNTTKPGDKIKLRVNEAGNGGGTVVVPVGAMTTGEVIVARRNGRG